MKKKRNSPNAAQIITFNPQALIPESEYLQQSIEETEDFKTRIYEHPIYQAIKKGNIKKIRAFLATLPDINQPYIIGGSPRLAQPNPLFYAACHGKLRVVKFLLSCGANLHHLNIHNQGVLLYTEIKKSPNPLFEYLLSLGADIFYRQSKVPCWLWENVIYARNANRDYYFNLLITKCSKDDMIELFEYFKKANVSLYATSYAQKMKTKIETKLIQEEKSILNKKTPKKSTHTKNQIVKI